MDLILFLKEKVKGSSQFPILPDSTGLSQASFPAHWTAPDSVIPTQSIARGLMETLPPCTIDIWRQPQRGQ